MHDPSPSVCDNYRWGQPPSYLLHVAARAAAAATAAGGGSKKAVYLGEFGVSLPDRHNASSPIYGFAEMLAAAQSSGAALATLWTWCENRPFVSTFPMFVPSLSWQ
eukprot:COSAG06_NODE_43538_length_371_cov_0.750000_1_plen_105_part_10